ncbi:hypothetical protein VC83_07421 [Pseudogymnoascus destructans]|uniref:mannan endo-1,4-beta-mannosidase n=2 Tax=Pseudogymnoascus destructans TaxID=655981 RepID=L8G779_PSED2|nr:uncharacterized protein VC83_07421 [Pseudogymnoascus destructans]ELR08699.1 hypothetical protein GMDG_03381 [Pseudogymnoascus destructans 20631-21]OAF56229.1 hypothetical protein VC83_07421 [Pseudogymnoascus destructans]
MRRPSRRLTGPFSRRGSTGLESLSLSLTLLYVKYLPYTLLTALQDYYHGGRFNFLRWRGINITQSDASPLVGELFTNRQIINDFKNYIRIHMTHKNPYTGLTYAQDLTILAYETGNELYGNVWGDMNVRAWVQEIAKYTKSLGPHKLVLDGTYGVNTTHLDIPEVDIYSDHFYPLDAKKLSAGIEKVRGAGKVYWSGEYAWRD